VPTAYGGRWERLSNASVGDGVSRVAQLRQHGSWLDVRQEAGALARPCLRDLA